MPEDFAQEPNPPYPPLQRGLPEITMEMNPEDVTVSTDTERDESHGDPSQ